MGATSFATVSIGNDARDAYKTAVRHATTEYGTDPYNGTISTTDGFKLTTAQFETEADVWEWINRTEEQTGKRDCMAVELPVHLAKRNVPDGMRAFLFVGWAAE